MNNNWKIKKQKIKNQQKKSKNCNNSLYNIQISLIKLMNQIHLKIKIY